MRSTVSATLALLVALAVCGLPVGIAAASAGFGSPSTDAVQSGADPPRGVTPAVDPNLTRPDPAVVMTINLTETGDARWTVASRFNLSGGNDTAAFLAFVDTLGEDGTAERIGYSAETFARAASFVEARTDRSEEMEVTDATWSSTVRNGTGVASLSFTWTNFARTEEDRVILDDVFTAGNGTWLQSIDDDQRLVIDSPPNYGVESSRYPTESISSNGSPTIVRITLEGPRDLHDSDQPIVYAPIDDTTPPPTTPGGPLVDSSWLVGGGFVLLLAAVVAGLVFYSRRGPAEAPARNPPPDAGTESSTDGGETTPAGGETPAESAESDAPAAEADPTDAPDEPPAGATAESEGDDEDDVDVELLSDEERVERLLEQNGGRMKQASIVTETGWSNAKVSQLLSSMDEEDRIDKLRIGRENLITLPDEDVGEID